MLWRGAGRVCLAGTLVAAGFFMGCERSSQKDTSVEEPSSRGWFDEVAVPSGLSFQHVFALEQRFYFPEIIAGGVGLLDYDGDGFLDVYFVQGGDFEAPIAERPTNRLYRNRGDGTFEDVTEATGTGDAGYGMGCACGDYDGDGDVDLYVTNVGPNVLFRNNGDGTFTNVAKAAGVDDSSWGTSATFVDYDADGHLDLFVVNYIDWAPGREIRCASLLDERSYCHPNIYRAPAPDTLFRNRGDGTFVNVSTSCGIRKAYGNGLGVTPGDFNGDGRLDFYVANDAQANQLWINDGEGRFTDAAPALGCDVNRMGAAEAGMGVAAVDVNHDGRLDIFLSHLRHETNTLYLNRGGWFDDVTSTLGLASASIPLTGFGLGFADFNHDARLDVYVANGRVKLIEPAYDSARPYAEPNLLFAGTADGRFEEVEPRGGTEKLLVESSRAVAFGDLDNDGDIDMVVVNNGGPTHLLRNRAGSRGAWATFRVVDRRGRFALGASVRATAGDRHQWRQVQRAYGYCASHDPRVHFGLGSAKRIDELLVRWLGGDGEIFGPFPAGAQYEIRQGNGRAIPNDKD